jgi:hypothetical protein
MPRREHDDTDDVFSALERDYAAHRVEVDAAARWMRAIVEGPPHGLVTCRFTFA